MKISNSPEKIQTVTINSLNSHQKRYNDVAVKPVIMTSWFISHISFMIFLLAAFSLNAQEALKLNELGYFEKQGLNVMVFSNLYDGNFSDSKISSVEIIHHGVRTATNGDVRLSATPGQWDPIPTVGERKVDTEKNVVEVALSYPKYGYNFKIQAEAQDGGLYLRVLSDQPLPPALDGLAGFNLEFLPSAYFGKSYLADGQGGIFPVYPAGPMLLAREGRSEPNPNARGKQLVLSPEDPSRHISLRSSGGEIMLFDGRNQAQNGWFVARTLIPPGKTGTVVEWFLSGSTVLGWLRSPSIAHSQVGYHPNQEKVAVIEIDKKDTFKGEASLLKVSADGTAHNVFSAKPESWGQFLRYNYARFDFSRVKEEGIYQLQYGTVRTKPFRIDKNVYNEAWHLTQDVFMPVQMDHMFVNEAYRVWHGIPHMDDALQAPVGYEHFDLYAQGATTDTPFKPGEHIPGLNIGGWFDAGDFDIRTQTHYAMMLHLVHAWETFTIRRDETTVDQARKYVDIHVPDGIPDMVQQIEHGTLALIAQHRALGHAIPGIVAPDLTQYTHLGDAGSKTNNVICTEPIKPFKWEEFTACNCDDRWAFTTATTPLNYGSAAALAAASRVLKGYNDALSQECLATAIKVWDYEHSREPNLFRFGNTTGGQLESEELNCAIELLISTKDTRYAQRIMEQLPLIERQFNRFAFMAIVAMPYMDETYRKAMRPLVEKYKQGIDAGRNRNPFGVFISGGGWAGNGGIINEGMNNYVLHKAFPDLIGKEEVLKSLNYIFGTHPDSDISFVSGVGAHSKQVAYGNNRADFSFIPGGIVPGVLLLKPDFPENKEDWPFLWGENEYVINLAASYIYLVHAASDVLK